MRRSRPWQLPFLLALTACASTDLPVPQAWMSTPQAKRVDRVFIREPADVKIETRPDGQVLVRGTNALTPAYIAIESFDVSIDRNEVAFSAKRKDNFDVALVNLDGSKVNWVPEESLDETTPRWAKRGNKFAYVLRSNNGDLVRTVHVPTATQLTIDFPSAVVNDIVWDAASERFTVTSESADASESAEVMKYGGEERRRVTPPAVKLDVSVEPFGVDTLVMRPSNVRYDEKLPLVVWLTTGRLNAWNDARGALMQRVHAATIVTTRPPDAAFWEKVRGTAWIDAARVFIVDAGALLSATPAGALTISGSKEVPTGRYRRTDRTVLVAPPVVESFAVGLVERELKGHAP